MKDQSQQALRVPAELLRLHGRSEGRRGARHRPPCCSPASWSSAGSPTPDYAPLYSNLSSSDASAVVDQLDTQGVTYKLTNGGDTVMVPENDVYTTRIKLSGEGLPSGSDGGYSLLDQQDLSTSQFKEQTDFKRAMEGELAKTIEAMDGVTVGRRTPRAAGQAGLRRQAGPAHRVRPGLHPARQHARPRAGAVGGPPGRLEHRRHRPGQGHRGRLHRQGALHQRLHRRRGASTRDQYVTDFQNEKAAQVQALLDRVLGPGNSTVQVTADLDFDKTTTELRKYTPADPNGLTLSTSKNSENYTGPAGTAAASGVVGPDGQMGTTTTGGTAGSSYRKASETSDNAVNTETQQIESAPGGVNSLHVGVALDRTAAANNDPAAIEKLITATVGIDTKRGDTVFVQSLPFDRTADKAAAKDTKVEAAAAAKADAG